MLRKMLVTNISVLLLVNLLVILTSCGMSGCQQVTPRVVIVPESQSVIFLDANESITVSKRSAVLDIGWYLQLVDLYMSVQSGEWERVEP